MRRPPSCTPPPASISILRARAERSAAGDGDAARRRHESHGADRFFQPSPPIDRGRRRVAHAHFTVPRQLPRRGTVLPRRQDDDRLRTAANALVEDTARQATTLGYRVLLAHVGQSSTFFGQVGTNAEIADAQPHDRCAPVCPAVRRADADPACGGSTASTCWLFPTGSALRRRGGRARRFVFQRREYASARAHRGATPRAPRHPFIDGGPAGDESARDSDRQRRTAVVTAKPAMYSLIGL